MAISEEVKMIPEAHAFLVTMRDHFGHKHEVILHSHKAVEDPAKPFPLGPVSLTEHYAPQMDNIRKMMRDRELAFLKHCLDNGHGQHALVLSHPDHPQNSGKPAPVQPTAEKDCGCGT